MASGMTGDWRGVGRMLSRLGTVQRWHAAKKRAALKEAHRLRGIMVRSFNAGGPPGKKWKALSTFTQILSRAQGKGDRRPLMDSGDLRNSHSVVEEDEDTVFVGIHRTATRRRKDGKLTMANIGAIHEFGAGPIYIPVTPVMRWWWNHIMVGHVRAQGGRMRPLRENTIAFVTRIPARPWIVPIWDQEKDNVASNVMSDTLRNIGFPGV